MLQTTFQSATCKTLGHRVNWYLSNGKVTVKTLTVKGYCWLTISVEDFIRGYMV